MEERKRIIVTMAVVLFTIIFNFSSISFAQDFDHHRLGVRYAYLNYSVEKMPLGFRSVPIHKKDDYARERNWGPIEDEDYERNHWLSLDYAYLWELSDRWSMGLGLVWILDFWSAFGDDQRRNYTNHPGTDRRGRGAALTFVSTGIRGLLELDVGEGDIGSLLNFTPQVVTEYAFNQEKDIRLGLGVSYHRFVALNGWDRHNSFEVDDKETLAHIFPVTAELVLKYATLGASYNLHSLTSFGNKADTEIGAFSFSLKLQGTF